jgi:metal-dependent amidase/aminoacylase/carboxypeptidase family protein
VNSANSGRLDSAVASARAAAIEAIEANREALVELSRFIHAHPEIAMQEVQASQACADFLRERGFAVQKPAAGF